MADVLLTVLPGSDSGERVAVMIRQESGESTIQLCQQTFSEAVGWFTQSSIELTPDQLSGLRGSLGGIPRPKKIWRDSRKLPVSDISREPILAFPA